MTRFLNQQDFFCFQCKKLPESAYTSQCCGCVLRQRCTDQTQTLDSSENCPSCNNPDYEFEKNVFLNKLINKFPTFCKYECSHVSQVSDMKNHYKSCDKRNYTCVKCKYEGRKEEFLKHITNTHQDQVINQFDSSEDKYTEQMDPLEIFVIGRTSKFYCGNSAQHKCKSCDGQCGPDDDCNCPPCMELNLKYRNLKGRKLLVNAAGRIALLKNGTFYCGVFEEDYGTCGKQNYLCRYCTSLTSDLSYYKHLLE